MIPRGFLSNSQGRRRVFTRFGTRYAAGFYRSGIRDSASGGRPAVLLENVNRNTSYLRELEIVT